MRSDSMSRAAVDRPQPGRTLSASGVRREYARLHADIHLLQIGNLAEETSTISVSRSRSSGNPQRQPQRGPPPHSGLGPRAQAGPMPTRQSL